MFYFKTTARDLKAVEILKHQELSMNRGSEKEAFNILDCI
jgi:hypothetical protein